MVRLPAMASVVGLTALAVRFFSAEQLHRAAARHSGLAPTPAHDSYTDRHHLLRKVNQVRRHRHSRSRKNFLKMPVESPLGGCRLSHPPSMVRNMSSTHVEPATDALDELTATLDQIGRLTARAVALAGEVATSGEAERREGLPLDLFIGLRHRMTHADRRMLVGAAEALRHLPVTAALFADGQLSWSQVRATVSAARRLTVEERATLDARIEAPLDQYGGVEAFDPDGLVDAVHDAVDEIKERTARQRERRQEHRNFLAVQERLGGGIKFHGEADALNGAAILGALDAKAGQPAAGAGEPPPPGEPTTRARQRLDALAGICADWLGGDSGRPARPLFTIQVDTADARPTGTLELACRGKMPRISAIACELLARDADFQAVLVEGARPLAVSRKLHAESIPADTRVAVGARDRGSRFPGSRDPIVFSDIHHIDERADGGLHHPDVLVALDRRSHRLVHGRGWSLDLDPDTAQLTITRRGRQYRSLPRGTPLARPPNRTNRPEDRAPPGMPF
jgi:hypothetical protein